MSETTELTTSLRMRPRSSCGAVRSDEKNLVTQTALVVARVRFAHWLGIPDAMVPRVPGAVWSPRRNAWQVQMFTLLNDIPGRVAGGTVSLESLQLAGVEVQVAPVANDLADDDFTPKRFAQCLKAAADLAEDGDWHFVVSALESALHLAKTQALAHRADETGVVTA
jgi:hypothetical protein